MANPLNVSIKVTGLDQAKADLQAFSTIGKRSFNEIAQEAKNFAQSAATTDPALRGVANRVRGLAAASDEAFASNLKLRQSISDVERAYKAEIISAEGVARITATLRAEHEKLANSTRTVVAEIKQLETIGARSYGAISAMAKRAAADIKPTAQGTHDLAVAMKEMSAAADPAAAAQMRLLNGLTQVQAALQQKIISTQQAAKLEIYLREQSQATARAEAELENKTRSAAAARAQASIQAANAQRAASQIAIAAMQAEIRQMDALSQKSFSDIVRGAPGGGRGPAAGTQGQVDLATQVRDLSAKANPMGAANLELQKQIVAVNRARQQGIILEKEEAKIIQYLHNEHNKYVDSLNKEEIAHKKNVPAVNASQQSVSKMNNTMTQLSFQINDIGTSLASGASPFMVLAQQGGQIYQVFQTAPGGAGGALKAFGETIMKLMTPMRLFIATLAAAGVGTAALVAGASRQRDELNKLSVSLEGVGRSSLVTASGMAEVAKQLRDMGVARSEANKIANDIARNPEINPAFAKQIVSTGADVGARLGVSTKEGIEEVTAALSDNTDAVIKLGIATGALDKDQIKLLTTMSRTGKEFEARTLAFKNLQAGTAGAAERVKTEWEKAFNALGKSWDDFITKLQNTSFIKNIETFLLGEIQSIKSFLDKVSEWMTSGKPGALPGSGSNAAPATGGRVGPGGAGGFTGYGGTAPVAPVISQEARLTPAEVKLTVDMDPRAVELFELTKQVTGETGVRITPHGATGGTHAKGSQHYPWNTSSGRGLAFDYTFPGIGYNQVPDAATAARYQRFNETAARLARERYGIEAGQGQNFPQYDPGHIDFRGLPALSRMPSIPEPQDRDLEAQRARAAQAGAAAGGVVLPDAKKAADTAAALDAANREAAKSIEIAKTAAGPGKAFQEAYWSTYLPLIAQGTQQVDANNAAHVAGAKARDLYNVQLEQGYTAEELAIKNEQGLAAALAVSEEAAVKATAEAAARAEVLQQGGNQSEIAERKLAAAMAQTHTGMQRTVNENKRRVEVLQLENSLSGETSETINYQVSLLQAKQKLQELGVALTSKEGQAYLKSAEGLAKSVQQHALIAREQQKQDEMWRKIGSTIESAIGDVIDSIFDPKKAIDWGKKVKEMMQGLLKDLAMNQFIKPMIGNLLGTFGASANVVQGFGGTGGSSGGTNISIGGGMFGGGGLFKELGIDSSGEGLFSGVNNFFGDIGGGIFGRSVPDFGGGGELGIAAGTGETAIIPGSVFGSTTFGTAIGSVGLGFTAGTMLNSLVGGKSTGGMIGSGVGSLAGMALGSMVGMPWLGALLGGAGGGLLGGMFGNNKPSNQSAGANIDLSQFRITSGFAGGNQQIDQQVAQMGQSLQGFLDLLKTTGGALSGNVLLQSGVNTGITVDSSLEGYAGRFNLGKDTDAALKVIEQALIKSITGVSDTMKTVLSQVGTDEDIAAAIQFAQAYESLSDAAEDAFASVEDGSKQMGPFATAMQQIETLFAQLTTSATRFGLSLEPINAALEEATARLQEDFTDALNEVINAASGSSFINELSQTIDDYIASIEEAASIDLADQATGDLLGTAFMAQINDILDDLDLEQLTEVVTEFQAIATNEAAVVTDLAVAMMATVQATMDLTEAQQRLASALTQIQDYIDQITATASFGVSPEDAFTTAQSQFGTQLAAAQGGDLTALEGITETADRFLQAIEGYYGSSEAGTQLFDQVVAQLQGLTGTTTATVTDPATGLIVETITAGTTAVTNVLTDQTGTISTGTQALIDNNTATAEAAIATNNSNMQTLYDITNETAATNMALNQENTAALIADATTQTTALLAQNEADKTAIVDANNANAALLIEANNAAAALAIENADAATQALIDQNNIKSGLGIASAQSSTQLLLDQAALDSEALLATTQESTTALLEQSALAAEAGLAATNASATAIVEQAGLASEAQLTATTESTQLLLDQATTAADAGLAATEAATTALIDQATLASEAQLAETVASTTAIVDQSVAASDAALAATAASTTALVDQYTLGSEASLAATEAATTALVDQYTLGSEAALAATEASTTAIVDQATLAAETALATAESTTQSLLDQATAASEAALVATEAATTALVDQYKADAEAALLESQAATASITTSVEESIAAQILANDAATALLTEGQDAATTALLESDGLTREEIIKLHGSQIPVVEAIGVWGADLHAVIAGGFQMNAEVTGVVGGAIVSQIAAGDALITASANTWSAAILAQLILGDKTTGDLMNAWGTLTVSQLIAGPKLVAEVTSAWGAAIAGQLIDGPKLIVENATFWGTDLHTQIIVWGKANADIANFWGQAQYNNTTAGATLIADTTGAWGAALHQATSDGSKLVAESNNYWSSAIYNQVYSANKMVADTITAWGGAVYQITYDSAVMVAQHVAVWSNAIYGQLSAGPKLIVDTISAWAPYWNAGPYDAANSVISAIAIWVGAQIGQDVTIANNAINNNTLLANGIVTAVYGSGNSIIYTLQNWIGAQINNDTALTNSLINVGATYSNAQLLNNTGLTNSIISTNATYSNNIITAIGTFGSNNYNWLNSINNWVNGIYNVLVQEYNQASSQRQDMINKLQAILNQLSLMANMPYYPATYNTGGV
jgi:hypothetical protein